MLQGKLTSSIPLYPISGKRSMFYNQYTAIAAFSPSLSVLEKTSDMMGDLKYNVLNVKIVKKINSITYCLEG